jgi:hypothetical protein
MNLKKREKMLYAMNVLPALEFRTPIKLTLSLPNNSLPSQNSVFYYSISTVKTATR